MIFIGVFEFLDYVLSAKNFEFVDYVFSTNSEVRAGTHFALFLF